MSAETNKKSKGGFPWGVIVIFLVIFGIGGLMYFMVQRAGQTNELAQAAGDQVVAKIEEYRAANGKLPNNVEELKTDKTVLEATDGYIMIYAPGGKSYTLTVIIDEQTRTVYSSATKTWEIKE